MKIISLIQTNNIYNNHHHYYLSIITIHRMNGFVVVVVVVGFPGSKMDNSHLDILQLKFRNYKKREKTILSTDIAQQQWNLTKNLRIL